MSNATGWTTAQIADWPIDIIDGDRSSNYPKDADFVSTGIPFLNTTNIRDGALDLSYLRFITQAKWDSIKKGRAQPKDILMTTRGTIGRIARFRCGFSSALINAQMLILRTDPAVLDSDFLFYVLSTADVQSTLRSFSSGSAQPQIPIRDLKRVPIVLPPFPVQQRIASILGAYDDLIEVNRRRIAVLEKMARGLFEEWFVYFRFPGHGEVPIEDTPDGPSPQGWAFDTLGNVAAINAASLKPITAPSEIGYIDIASVSPGQINAINHMPFSEAPGRARRLVKDGSILWSNVRPNRRSFALVLDPAPEIVVSTGFTVLDARETSFTYLYHWVTTEEFTGYLVGNAQGAAYPAVTAATFERATVLLPPSDLVGRFTDFGEPTLRLSDDLRKAIVRLAASRDLLLPRLISGRLSVAQAERELEAA